MNYDVECGLISKLVETSDMKLIKDKRINREFFSGEAYKVFSFIEDHYIKYAAVPTDRIILAKFPAFVFEKHDVEGKPVIGTSETLAFWIDEVRRKKKHNTLASVTEEVAKSLAKGESHSAYAAAQQGLLRIETEIEENTAIDITADNIDERKKEYLKRKETKGIIGIPTGISYLDSMLRGLQPEQLITMIARTGIGKTWFQVLVGANAHLQNYRVLHLITEMSETAMRDRYEAMLMGLYGSRLSYSRFKSGTLTPDEETDYFNFLDSMGGLDSLVLDVVSGVSDVVAGIEVHKPDLVLIDGAYLMEDERGAKEDWLRIAHITRDLKLVAKRTHLPIFINSQADSTTSKKTGPELDNIAYARAVGQDSDVVLALFQDNEMRNDKEMKVKVLKQREGVLGSVMLSWDFTTMNFTPLYSREEVVEDSSTAYEATKGVVEV